MLIYSTYTLLCQWQWQTSNIYMWKTIITSLIKISGCAVILRWLRYLADPLRVTQSQSSSQHGHFLCGNSLLREIV